MVLEATHADDADGDQQQLVDPAGGEHQLVVPKFATPVLPAGICYTLTGQAAVSFGHVAKVLGHASGRPIRHVDASLAEHRAYFVRSGRPDAWVDHMMHLFELVRAGMFTPVTDDVQLLTGKSPRSLEAYAKEVVGR